MINSHCKLHDEVIKWKHFPRNCMALYAGNSPVTGEFPAQRPVTWSFNVFFNLRLDKRLSKQLRGWSFKKPTRLLWRLCNEKDVLKLLDIHLQQKNNSAQRNNCVIIFSYCNGSNVVRMDEKVVHAVNQTNWNPAVCCLKSLIPLFLNSCGFAWR